MLMWKHFPFPILCPQLQILVMLIIKYSWNSDLYEYKTKAKDKL